MMGARRDRMILQRRCGLSGTAVARGVSAKIIDPVSEFA
jgi:hypothetical protein